jgi:hypothetical protein
MDEAYPAARVWNGHVPGEHAAGFLSHLISTGVQHATSLGGCLGVTVLQRPDDRGVRFTLLTYWRDETALSGFARDTSAVHYLGDSAFRAEHLQPEAA